MSITKLDCAGILICKHRDKLEDVKFMVLDVNSLKKVMTGHYNISQSELSESELNNKQSNVTSLLERVELFVISLS